MEIVVVTLVLVVAVILLMTERIPVDLTAIGVMVVLALTGILTPGESVAGFANPAPITVGLLLVVARGLSRTGALDAVTDAVVALARGRGDVLLALCLVVAGGLSAFLNNTPVVVLLMSVVIAVTGKYGLSPSKFLLPVSYMSILAGTTTLIGTSTNILVSDLAADSGLEPLGMFELARLGGPLAVAGGLLLLLVSPRLLPSHREPVVEIEDRHRHRYVSELVVPPESPLVGLTVPRELSALLRETELYEVIRGDRLLDPLQEEVTVEAGDVLLVKASASDLVRALDGRMAALPARDSGAVADPAEDSSLIAELVVAPGAELVGRTLADALDDLDPQLYVLGVKRGHVHYAAHKADRLRLSVGDILLVQAPLQSLDHLRSGGELIVVEDVGHILVNRRKAPLAMAVFVGMVVAAATGVLDIMVAAMAAAAVLLATRCLSMREAYRALDARVLLLIVGTIALGSALATTGAADLYAHLLLTPLAGASPHLVLGAFMLLASVLSLFLSNNSTAVLLVPVALSTAAALEVDPRPFIVALCFGASACYASPIGYQTNLLVFGPGGYHVRDYLRLGLPLHLLVLVSASLLVPVLWPF